MATLGEGQAGEREAEMGDVYHTGMLFFKTGKFTTQKYLAQLKFESISGPKRIDFYPMHSNPASPGNRVATIPLTHVLKVHPNEGIMRGKHAFQILTTYKGKFQLGAGSQEDKVTWMEKIDQMCKNLPVGDRTYEFHVMIHSTAHSERLRLQGQYILKVTTSEVRLFGASNTLPTQFWSPLLHIQKAHCCVLPTTSNSLGAQHYGGLYGSSSSTTQSLLIITTESTSPVDNGGFVFVTQSAADIAAIINHRRTKILNQRAAATPSAETGTREFPVPLSQLLASQTPPNSAPSSHARQETDRHRGAADCSTTDYGARPPKGKVEQIQSLHFGPTGEREQATGANEPRLKKDFDNVSKFDRTSQSLYTQKSRGRNSFQRSSERVHARRPHDTPLKQQQGGRSLLHLDLPERSIDSSIVTPEEPRYITNRELDDIRMQWQMMRESDRQRKSKTSVISPEERAYYNGEFMKAVLKAEKAAGHGDERERSGPARQSSKTKGLERQGNIDILSPMKEEEEEEEEEKVVNVRPRSNAFSELMENYFPQQQNPHSKPFPLPRKQTAPALFQDGGKEAVLLAQPQRRTDLHIVLRCTQEGCRLGPKQPTLAETKQKSNSDPQLTSPRSPMNDYVTIIAPEQAPKSGRKPMPAPRVLRLPPKPAQPRAKLASPQFASQPAYGNLDVGIEGLLSQRSISEFNLHSLTNEELYENTRPLDDLPTPYVSIDDDDTPSLCNLPLPSRRRIFRRQKSGSVGDIPNCPSWRVTTDEDEGRENFYENGRSCHDTFLHTEELYENGKECMDYYMYGSMEFGHQPWQPSSCGDSGIGCTPNSSPFLGHKSFSMDDLRAVDREGGEGRHWGKETAREDEYDSQPSTSSESEEDTTAAMSEGEASPRPPVPTPRVCVFQMCGRTRHADRKASPQDLTRVYENVPLLTC